MGPTLYQIAYCYILMSQHLAMDELFEIWKQLQKKKTKQQQQQQS